MMIELFHTKITHRAMFRPSWLLDLTCLTDVLAILIESSIVSMLLEVPFDVVLGDPPWICGAGLVVGPVAEQG